MIRIGVIGAGGNTVKKHIPGFQSIEQVSVDVVCNRSDPSSRRVADRFKIPRIAGHWQDVVTDDEIDAICIGTWPYMHAAITIAALEQGKHVLTEARMAMDGGEAEKMLAASRAHAHLVAQVVPSPMTLDWDPVICDFLDRGEIGQLREVNFVKTMATDADSSTALSWRQDTEYSGHNVMMLGIYYEAARRWLRRDPIRVSASGSVFTRSRYDQENECDKVVEIAETVIVVADYDGGVRLTGHMSGLEAGAGRDGFYLNGSNGCLRLDPRKDQLFKTILHGDEEQIVLPAEQRRGWQVEVEFIASIRERTPVTRTSFTDGVAYMRFTDAVFESINGDGKWVAM